MKFSIPFSELSKLDPLRIAVAMGAGTVICILLGKLFFSSDTVWMIAMSGSLLYAWLVPVLSFISNQWAKHSFRSVVSYLLLTILFCFLAGLITGVSIFDLREYQLLISAMTLFFFVGVFMSRVLRAIVKFMENG